ncbi:MAG: hypothetical protein R3Y54_04025 [Eubacteriales bacterium]
MDNFMDTIAQKLSAQDVIEANSNAEASELKKLQLQVSEYERILETLKQIDLSNFDVNNIDITSVMEKFVNEVKAVISTIEVKQEIPQDNTVQRQEYMEMQRGQLQAIERIIEENFAIQRAKAEADERVRAEAELAKYEAELAREEAERSRMEADDKIREEAERLRAEADDQIRIEAERAKYEAELAREEAELLRMEADDKIREESEKLLAMESDSEISEEAEDSLREYIHTESVKVYRNVQAVVVQGLKDQAKKTETSETNILEQVKALKTCMIAVGILLALDFIVDGINLAWTILSYFNVRLF